MTLSIAMFYHSLVSDWNHGNAHFLRGIASEFLARGHRVRIFEPRDAWSRANLVSGHGEEAISRFHRAFPHLSSVAYTPGTLDFDPALDGIDLILAHEWNPSELIAGLGGYRRGNAHVRLLFHDTHHRALTAEQELARFDLADYDGVLAYGASLKETYDRRGWGKQVHIWHEAADIRTFYPRASASKAGDIVWIGNWGDEERTQELRDFFISPVQRRRWIARVYGVRYPPSALAELNAASIGYGGWLPNFEAPHIFAQYKATVHIPRRPYTECLPGIPTIRPFEALACGIPLVSAPWSDSENLFRVNEDFLMARSAGEMEQLLADVLNDASLASSLSGSGLETIRNRHTCGHRVNELLALYAAMKPASRLDTSGSPLAHARSVLASEPRPAGSGGGSTSDRDRILLAEAHA
ncbi:MAG: CgeB family protein [Bryobacteraceae bacterium]